MPHERAWLWALVLGAVATAVSVTVELAPAARVGLYLATPSAAAVGTVVGIRRHRPRGGLAWHAVTAAAVLGSGAVAAYGWQSAQSTPWSYPTPADLLQLGVSGLLVGALLLGRRARSPRQDAAALIDGCITTLALAVLALAVALPASPVPVPPVRFVQPAIDVVLLAVMIRLLPDGGRRRPAMVLAVGAVLAVLWADIVAVSHRLQGQSPPEIAVAGLLAAVTLWAAAALHPSLGAVTSGATRGPAELESRLRLAMFGSAALLPPVLELTRSWHGRALPWLPWATTAMVALLLVRFAWLVGEQRRTAAVRAEFDRRRADARLAALVDNSSDLVVLVDPDGCITYVTPSVQRSLGRGPQRLLGRPLTALIPDDRADGALRVERLKQLPPGRPQRLADCALAHRDGAPRVFDMVATNLLEHPDVGAVVLNGRNVTTQRRLEHQLREQAMTDPLTGLANRTLFTDRVSQALLLRRRDPLTQVGILFVDLDDFKTVNDGLGHAAGDELLITIAERLQTCIRAQDTAARLGGDEFAVVLIDTDVSTAAEQVADRILERLDEPTPVGDRHVRLAASIGMAVTDGGTHGTAEELLRQADIAMYAVKTAGKGGRTSFSSDMHDTALRRLDLTADLENALRAGQFSIMYQPVVELTADTRIVAVEALVRWEHPERGRIPPDDFIALAEETGAIIPLGRWVLQRACAQLAEWQTAEGWDDAMTVAVNVSGQQLRHCNFVQDVTTAIASSGIRPDALTLELTESTLIEAAESTDETLTALRRLGVRISVDDFGTGYSSLSYLGRLPIDTLKIDRSFVSKLPGNDEAGLIGAILSIAGRLGVATVAEGIETPEQRSALAELGCDYGQGHLFGRALHPDVMRRRVVMGSRPTAVAPPSASETAAAVALPQ